MFLHAEKSEAESSVGRVAELEAALREEKERHQTEMLALQEEFARDIIQIRIFSLTFRSVRLLIEVNFKLKLMAFKLKF